uniref:Uncharacterized protein n=1 Tax=Candidatus Kentrum sp. TUN TaxID=2126343 RepID=A0A451AES8_9GAMM|nr:MAG: hypothetical protein BECKTUN1418F_GA0071002_11004 [Candidatus Kentron sp. TUN]VFK61240.1 MAG: hypothetical protein BECKTUN1418D_GA0071000_11472 [Candidatus Kentron sp. TUN]VFK64484.1 MAG: hypothetical protein BECKTUN1418E_GA0071001_10964 [Candidatus Kentron sp. TUN]
MSSDPIPLNWKTVCSPILLPLTIIRSVNRKRIWPERLLNGTESKKDWSAFFRL